MKEHRIIDQDGQPLVYTCENYRFLTDITKGQTHGDRSRTRGSVFSEPLTPQGGYSLWLEHVIEKGSAEELYWLMWYDEDGRPPMPMSSILRRDDIANMQRLLASFIP
jgi:hypothetical protein